MASGFLPDRVREFRGNVNTRPMTSADAARAADLVCIVRERPNDRIDPFPPATEMEVLVDSGARGKGPDRHPLVATEDEEVVGCGSLDCSTDMRTAVLSRSRQVHRGHSDICGDRPTRPLRGPRIEY